MLNKRNGRLFKSSKWMNLLWLRRAFLAALGSLAAARGCPSQRCVAFSGGFCRGRAPALALGLTSCGACASLLAGTWDLPGLGTVCPARAGRFLTPGPQGSLRNVKLLIEFSYLVDIKHLASCLACSCQNRVSFPLV